MIDLKFKLCMMYRNWTMHVMLLRFKILCWFCVEARTLLHELFLAGLDCTKECKCHSWPHRELFLAGLDCTKGYKCHSWPHSFLHLFDLVAGATQAQTSHASYERGCVCSTVELGQLIYGFVVVVVALYYPLWEIQVALPIPASVCSVFMCPDNGMAASVCDF